MKISKALHALVARIEKKILTDAYTLNCSIVNLLFSNDPVKSSMLADRRSRRPVCRTLIVDILVHRGRREFQSAVDGVLRCCRSAGTVQTGMAVPCRADIVMVKASLTLA